MVDTPRILDRLPPHLRGELFYLVMVRDACVDIGTDKGVARLPLRFAEAVAETEGVDGLQIHGAHWVALDHVTEAVQLGGRPLLKMRDGRLLAVGRPYLEAVRAVGLF